MERQESNIDRLLKARAEIDQELRRQKAPLTIVFTDVVGSTSYFDRYGDTAGFAMLQRHSELATKTFGEHQGTIIKLIGDSVMAEFPEPLLAIRGAIELQRRLTTHNKKYDERDSINLRIGINSGTGFRHEHDVYGDAVNLAARICKKTGPAQILISRSVREAIASESEVRCKWLGKVALAGKAEAEDIYEVVWTDTAEYTQLRQNLTAAFMAGQLVSPGLSPDDLLQPKPAPTPVSGSKPTPSPASGATAAAAPSPAAPPSDPVAERFEILDEIGSGGMGVVYKARDRETGEMVALKMLRPEIAADPVVMERFKNELRVTRRITHRNVCRIYDLHRSATNAYIAMEHLEGESLRQVLVRFGPFGSSRGVQVALQICAGLREAHAQDTVHRDLKPENIMLDRSGNVKLMDFGIARAAGTRMTVTGAIIGTPAYMAPEQVEGKPADKRSDIYSLGLVMYEMFTGTAAFHGETPIAIALAQIQQSPPSPRDLGHSVHPAIETVILRCLEKDPERRFQSVVEVENALSALSGVVTPVPASMPRPTPAAAVTPQVAATVPIAQPAEAGRLASQSPSRSGVWLVLATLVAIAVGGVLAWVITARRHQSVTPPAAQQSAPAAPITTTTQSPQPAQPSPPAAVEEMPRAPVVEKGLEKSTPVSKAQPLVTSPTVLSRLPVIRYVPGSTVKLEQLLGEEDKERHRPTLSRTFSRYQLAGGEFGYSFEHEDRAYFLFGDTVGYLGRGLDTIATTDARDPELGVRLDFLTAGADPYLTVQPPGISMGPFEWPVAGISLKGQMYVVVKTNHSQNAERSVLTKVLRPFRPANFQPLRTISQSPQGRFIQLSMHTEPGPIAGMPPGGPFVMIWGIGQYSNSHAYLSIVPEAHFETGEGTRYFAGLNAAGAPNWSASESDAKPIVENSMFGELSVTWCKDAGLWLMAYDARQPRNSIEFSYSRTPWGPWSTPQTLLHRNEAIGKFIHNPRAVPADGLAGPVFGPKRREDPADVPGRLYAPFVIERFTRLQGSELNLYYVVSTWNPYVVVLMKSRLKLE